MEELRQRKDTDQEVTEKAFNLLKDCMAEHSEIEPTLWAGACWSALVHGYRECGISYEDFCVECDAVKNHYECWFDNKD